MGTILLIVLVLVLIGRSRPGRTAEAGVFPEWGARPGRSDPPRPGPDRAPLSVKCAGAGTVRRVAGATDHSLARSVI